MNYPISSWFYSDYFWALSKHLNFYIDCCTLKHSQPHASYSTRRWFSLLLPSMCILDCFLASLLWNSFSSTWIFSLIHLFLEIQTLLSATLWWSIFVHLYIFKLTNCKLLTYFWAIHRLHLDDILQRAVSLLDIDGSKFGNVLKEKHILHRLTTVSQQEISELHFLSQCSLCSKEYFCNFIFNFRLHPPKFQTMVSMIELSIFFK